MSLLHVTAPCPYCYTDIDLRKVAFRCPGRAAVGKKECVKDIDRVRATHFGDLKEYYPAFVPSRTSLLSDMRRTQCPDCLGSTGVRLCPQCHSRLPSGFSSDSSLFGLVGARSSGKTVMLAVLMRELAMNGPVGRRFRDTIRLCKAGDNNGQEVRLERLLKQMESPLGQLPALLATNGIILLLDPFSFPGNAGRGSAAKDQRVETAPENVLHAITEVMRQNEATKHNRKIKQPVAIVISKIDAFWSDIPENNPIRRPSSSLGYYDEAEGASVHDHIASMVSHWGGDGLLTMLETNYENYRFFGLSALGSEPDYAMQRVDERGLMPHRVAEPLLWLMAQRGFLPKQG